MWLCNTEPLKTATTNAVDEASRQQRKFSRFAAQLNALHEELRGIQELIGCKYNRGKELKPTIYRSPFGCMYGHGQGLPNRTMLIPEIRKYV